MDGLRCGRIEFEPKSAPLIKDRFNTTGAAHAFHRAGDDSQADTGPFVIARAIATLENTENLTLSVGRYADAVVFHPNADSRCIKRGRLIEPGFGKRVLTG